MSARTDQTKDLSVRRKSFIEQAGLSSLSDIGHLTEADLVEMCILFPQAMAQLIIELAANMRTLQTRLTIKERNEEKAKGKNDG